MIIYADKYNIENIILAGDRMTKPPLKQIIHQILI